VAHTDTVGGDALNDALAMRRARSVAELLREQGGIGAARIFVAPLAKKDLPALTAQDTENPANRTVQMILIPLPAQRPR